MDIQANLIDPERCLDFVPESDILDQALSANNLDSVIESLRHAERPVIWLGHGIRLAKAEHKLNSLLNVLNVPALISWAGIDMVDSDHPLLFVRAGVYGQRCANFVLQNCDYLLSIGTRLAIPQIGYDLTELAREAVIDVVDIDATEAKNINLGQEIILYVMPQFL